MKIIDIVARMPKGSIVRDKRVLAYFKRIGLICDYSKWGYLESQQVHFIRSNGEPDHDYFENGRILNEGEKGSLTNPFTEEEFYRSPFKSFFSFKWNGFEFENTFVSGCFQPYLRLKF